MLPDNVLSTQTIQAGFRFPRNIPRTDIVDYSIGGINFNDASQGLETNTWRASLDLDTGGITMETIGVPPTVWHTVVGATTFSFAFDQNMNPLLTYDTAAGSYYYWFDTVANTYVTTTLPAGSQWARCGLDDPRRMETGSSDIIIAYLRAGVLYFRAQRDRYLVEYALESGLEAYKLHQVGLNEKLRFQFQLRPIDE